MDLGRRGDHPPGAVRVVGTAGVVAAAVAMLAWPQASDAITRDRAERIALRKLAPSADNLNSRPPVAVFGLRKRLPRRAVVTEARPVTRSGPSRRTSVRRVKRLRRPAWLFWRDSTYGAKFAHPSVMLLVDARSGKVAKRRRMEWWPLVDGRKPRFLRDEAKYLSARFKIYSDLDLAGRGAPSDPDPQPVPPASPATVLSAGTGGSGPLASDCMLTLHDRDDERTERDVEAMEAAADRLRLRHFRVEAKRPGGGPTASDLRRNVTELVDEQGCKDILLYVSSHSDDAGAIGTGYTARVKGKPRDAKAKLVEERVQIKGSDIVRAIAEQIDTTFKLKFEVCYSGLQLDLIDVHNVLIVETAGTAEQPSYFGLPGEVRKGSDGEPYVIENLNNPERISEFTNRNVVGLARFATDPQEVQHAVQQVQGQGTSLLAWALSRAFALGENADFANTLGLTDAQIRTKFHRSAPGE